MIVIKTENEIELMRKACKITKQTLDLIEKNIKPGVKLSYLNAIAEEFILNNGCTPTFKNYNGFPYAICTSLNNEVVHGIPNDRMLKEGDIISCDVGACWQGYTGDAARTFPVGKVSSENANLIQVCRQSFFEGIKGLKAGSTLKQLAIQIQTYVEANGFSVVKEMCGHGVGKALHEDPQILNYNGYLGSGGKFHKNQTVAIEPMINAGNEDVDYNYQTLLCSTADGKNSAHYENTVLITESGAEILTI